MSDPTDFTGKELKVGDAVEAYYLGEPFTATITEIRPPHPACEGHAHLTIRRGDSGVLLERSSDSVVLLATVVSGETSTSVGE